MRPSSNKNTNLMFFLGFFLTILYCSCFADELSHQTAQQSFQSLEQIENPEQLGNYIANYYKNPKPGEIPKLVDILLGDKNFMNPFNAAVVMAFLTRVAKDNPEKIKEWFEQIKISSPNKLANIYRAIWDSDTQQSREFLEKLANGDDKLLSGIAKKITSRPPEEDILDEKMLSGGWIDRAWAVYAASGDSEYLKRILMIISSKKLTEIYADDGLISMATWSLNSMRKKDKIVDEKVRAIIADNPKLEYRIDKKESEHDEL